MDWQPEPDGMTVMNPEAISAGPTTRPRPSLGKRVAFNLLVWPCLLGTFLALGFANIVPSDSAWNVEAALSVVYAAVWATILEVVNRGRVWRSDKKGHAILGRPWTRIPFGLVIGFMFGYFSFVWGYPWLINELLGSRDTREFVVTDWESGGRNCSRPRIGHGLFTDGPRAFCVRADAREQLPPGTSIRVEGPATFLGINTDRIYVLKPTINGDVPH